MSTSETRRKRFVAAGWVFLAGEKRIDLRAGDEVWQPQAQLLPTVGLGLAGLL
jgi:hypothetical protein